MHIHQRPRKGLKNLVSIIENICGINFKRFYFGKGAAATEQIDLTYKDMLMVAGNITPYSARPTTKPVDTAAVNNYTHAVVKTWNPVWKSMYGDWFIMPLRHISTTMGILDPVNVLCSDGRVRQVYDARAGWPGGEAGTTVTKDVTLSFWDSPGISGTAGGSNVSGSATAWFNGKSQAGTSHFDHTNYIEILLGICNDPFMLEQKYFKCNFLTIPSTTGTKVATSGTGNIDWKNITNLQPALGKFAPAGQAMNSPGQAYGQINDVFDSTPNVWTMHARIRANNLNKNRLLSIFDADNKEICSITVMGVGGSDVSVIWPFYVSGVANGINTAGAVRSNINNWIEVMVVKNGNDIAIYINGQLSAAATSSIHNIPANARFMLFGGPGGNGNIANTQIEFLHIWPGYAAAGEKSKLFDWLVS